MDLLALIIRTAGTNCDQELSYAFELAGAQTNVVHLNELIANPRLIEEADLVGFPGGFSYGDDIAAGRIFADRLRRHLSSGLLAAIERRVPMIGICNGFQVLVSLGLLPMPANITLEGRPLCLAQNFGGRFVARWTKLLVNQESVSVWTRGLDQQIELPVAHAEGRLVFDSPLILEKMRRQGQVVLEYGMNDSTNQNDNPNGSTADIAGICDPTGLVLGLMPHPERYTVKTHHPQWTRYAQGSDNELVPYGLAMFQSAVQYARQNKIKSSPPDLVRS